MTKYNANNERIKRNYLRHQKEANQKADSTITGIQNAINRFEAYTNYKNFSTFNKEQAIAFKKHLAQLKTLRTGEPFSKSTILSTLNLLKEFFRWLSCQPGFKSKIHLPDIDYFNPSDKDISIAKASKFKSFPTLEQIKKVIFTMPCETDIQRRDRALIAFTILTGMRDSALASLRLKHVDLSKSPPLVKQEPDLVKTKFSKQIFTYFFPVGDEIAQIAIDWIKELREEKHYGINDPVFPQTRVGHDQNASFTVEGLEPICWASTTPIRQIFKEAFQDAGLPYFNPHLFRDTLTHFGQEICNSAESFKAWSQNLGHENVLTTLTSYGYLDTHRQGEIMKALKNRQNETITLSTLLEAINRKG